MVSLDTGWYSFQIWITLSEKDTVSLVFFTLLRSRILGSFCKAFRVTDYRSSPTGRSPVQSPHGSRVPHDLTTAPRTIFLRPGDVLVMPRVIVLSCMSLVLTHLPPFSVPAHHAVSGVHVTVWRVRGLCVVLTRALAFVMTSIADRCHFLLPLSILWDGRGAFTFTWGKLRRLKAEPQAAFHHTLPSIWSFHQSCNYFTRTHRVSSAASGSSAGPGSVPSERGPAAHSPPGRECL